MKHCISALSLLAFLVSAVLSYGADKVVVVPLGKSIKTTQKTFYYNLSPAAFIPVLLSGTIPIGNFIAGQWFSLLSPNTVVGLAAPLQLPDGSEITDFSCSVYDNDSDINYNVSSGSIAYIWRRPIDSPDREDLFTLGYGEIKTEGSSETIQSFTAVSNNLATPAIDNSLYAYGVYALYKITGNPALYTDLRFYGCRVTYTLDVIEP